MKRNKGWMILAVVLAIGAANSTHVIANDVGAAGLTTQWQTQVQMDPTRDQLVEAHVHVHDDRAISYYEIRYGNVRETVSLDDLDPRGVPFRDLNRDDPLAGAREWAQLRKEILEAEGKSDVSVELITVPRTTVYTLSGFGGIHAIDGETGQTRWKVRIGSPYDPTIGMASNNRHLVAVRGSKIYCLDALNGDVLWSRFCAHAPGGGVAVSEDFAYVTSVKGHLQMYPLNENGLPERKFASSGPATYDPSISGSNVSWTTERGYFNVARSDVASMRYRLQTGDEFRSASTAVGDYLVANSTAGKVYALLADQGVLAWERAVGERLSKQPIAVDQKTVVIITGSDTLMALDVTKGVPLEGWPEQVRGISEYVGASPDRLYFITVDGRLVGLHRDTGTVATAVEIGDDVMPITNSITDRLYLADSNGRLVCLRELAHVNPVLNSEDFVVSDSATERERAEAQQQAGAETEETTDPFASGGQASEKPETADPFASPPKSEKDDKPADPFGGGAGDSKDEDKPEDPFGGGGGDDSKKDDDSDDDAEDPFDGTP